MRKGGRISQQVRLLKSHKHNFFLYHEVHAHEGTSANAGVLVHGDGPMVAGLLSHYQRGVFLNEGDTLQCTALKSRTTKSAMHSQVHAVGAEKVSCIYAKANRLRFMEKQKSGGQAARME